MGNQFRIPVVVHRSLSFLSSLILHFQLAIQDKQFEELPVVSFTFQKKEGLHCNVGVTLPITSAVSPSSHIVLTGVDLLHLDEMRGQEMRAGQPREHLDVS